MIEAAAVDDVLIDSQFKHAFLLEINLIF